jgi:hypothetical protein
MASPSLSIEQQREIERLLSIWRGQITWDGLVDRIELKLKINTTRQTLNKYKSVRNAYRKAKRNSRIEGVSLQDLAKFTKTDVKLIEKVKQLEAENVYLDNKVDLQLMFIKDIANEAEFNPLLMDLLISIKHKAISKKRREHG